LFIPLLIFSIVVFIATMVGFTLLFLPGVAIIVAVTFGCLYMLPLMTEKDMGLVDAIKGSWQMAIQDKIADHLVVVIIFVGLTAIGSSVFIGTLFTQPFATVFVLSAFWERQQSFGQSAPIPPAPPAGGPDTAA
jgi:membrane-anchored glycerophosphoryl diester phosphodiesterase (GDPDase)